MAHNAGVAPFAKVPGIAVLSLLEQAEFDFLG